MAQEPSQAVTLTGVHAYAEKSIAAGDTLHFRVSSDAPYTLSVVKPGWDLDAPTDDEPVPGLSAEGQARQQPIFPGSYVNVDMAMPAPLLQAMTLECWVRPWGQDAMSRLEAGSEWQGLISKHSYPERCGFGLFLTETKQVVLYFGDGGRYDPDRAVLSPESLELNEWSHLVGVWDGKDISLWVNGRRVVGPSPLAGPVRPGTAPLRLAAYGQHGVTQNFLNGDLAMPVIYSKALSQGEISRRHEDKGLHPPALQGVLACWPLVEERGNTIKDISGNGLDGHIINRATWMIGGPSFNGNEDPSRFTTGYDPTQDATRGHGLRFCSLDLYDCGWQVSHSFPLPDNLTPGIYVGRLSYGPNEEFIYDVTFVVRKARGQPKAPLLVLCAMNSWLAYSGTPFLDKPIPKSDPRQRWYPEGPDGAKGVANTPFQNFYEDCPTGQPTYRLGLNLPWPVAAPYAIFSPVWEDGVSYSHLVRAERFTHRWLEDERYPFDVITDFDLHLEPDVLESYQAVIIAGHSEYWSVPAYEGLKSYLAQGGKVIVLSGNTMYWRVSFDCDMTAMECRKYGGISGTRPNATPGEGYHSDDGKLGGLMRLCGHPCWKLLGLESTGAIGNYEAQESYQGYTCALPGHPFLAGTDLEKGDSFAQGAVGHEWDVCIDQPQMKTPSIIDPSLPGLETLAYSKARGPGEDVVWGFNGQNLDPQPDADAGILTSQLIYWKRPEGGEVFYAGSIAAGQALHSDARWATLLNNVLESFGVVPEASGLV